ncbi:MAG: hypothetical protein HZA91_17540 [Verrucomicrobia bacterium]|nr:hypothetical protein [Verrucomicrobiota bacterium]
MNDAFHKELFRAMWNVCPILKEIRFRPQTEGRNASYQRDDGTIVETDYKQRSVEREWKFEDARGLDPEAFLQTASDMGEEMGKKMMTDLLTTVKAATEEVGNVVNCEGKRLTFEKFLEMVTKIYTEFDDFGQPRQKALLLPPEACQQVTKQLKEWESDPAKRDALEQAIEQHRKAFYERETRRRMVD